VVNLDNIRNLLTIKKRRLQKLEEQRALLGINTPAEILIEIEDIIDEIRNLNETLGNAVTTEVENSARSLVNQRPTNTELVYERRSTKLSTHRSVVIYLPDHQMLSISHVLIHAAVRAFAGVLGIDPETVEIYGAFRGSLILSLGIPSNAVDVLIELLKHNSVKLRTLIVKVKSEGKFEQEDKYPLTVSKIIVESQAGVREGWMLKNDQFQHRLRTIVSPIAYAQNEKAKQLIEKAMSANQFVLPLNGMGLTELPREIGMLTQLRTLSLTGNKLAYLPTEFGNLRNLRSLSLRNNQFTIIPASIGELANLRQLDIRGNLITELPENLEKLISQNKEFLLQYDADILSRH